MLVTRKEDSTASWEIQAATAQGTSRPVQLSAHKGMPGSPAAQVLHKNHCRMLTYLTLPPSKRLVI